MILDLLANWFHTNVGKKSSHVFQPRETRKTRKLSFCIRVVLSLYRIFRVLRAFRGSVNSFRGNLFNAVNTNV